MDSTPDSAPDSSPLAEQDGAPGGDRGSTPDGAADGGLGGSRAARRTLLVALGLVVVELVVRGLILNRSYYANDDFPYISTAAESGLGWSYLTSLYFGQFMPGALALIWVLEWLGPYDWGTVCVVVLALQAWASLALLRLLRLMFGARPAILVPFVVYLLSPLTLTTGTWWATAVQSLPLQIGLLMAVAAYLRYLDGGRRRDAVATGCWLVFGLIFFVKAVLIVPLLFALTWALRRPMTKRVAALWGALVVLLAGFGLLYWSRTSTSVSSPRRPGLDAVPSLVGRTFATEASGGPLKWKRFGAIDALNAAPTAVIVAAWVVVALVVGASLYWRRRAVRGWLILLGYLLAEIVIVSAGRPVADVTGKLSRYVADAAPVLAIVLALAYLPLLAETDAYRRPPPRWSGRIAFAGLVLFTVASVISTAGYASGVRTKPVRAYMRDAASALDHSSDQADIYPRRVPGWVLSDFFGTGTLSTQVLGPLARPPLLDRMRNPQPAQAPMVFNDSGRLRPLAIFGAVTGPQGRRCFVAQARVVDIPIAVPGGDTGVAALSYEVTTVTHVRAEVGVESVDMLLPPGRGQMVFPLHTPGQAIKVTTVGPVAEPCLLGAAAGVPS